MDRSSFYDQVPILTDFTQVTRKESYKPAPDDWWLISADISNSTKAIEEGKYKEVNMAGASVIAAISNIFKDSTTIPFAFGGDGASILIPDSKIAEVDNALAFCSNAVLNNFGLEMKTGRMNVQQIREAGYEIAVAKLKLSEIISLPVFWGDGISYAEQVIKQKPYKPVQTEEIHDVSMDGLECRWQEIPPDHDEITNCIIIAAGKTDEDKADIYSDCMQAISGIYGSLDSRNPLSEEKLSFTKSLRKLSVEWKMRTWKPSFKRQITYALKLTFQLLVGKYLMYRSVKTKNTDWGLYKGDLIKHADFRKFGDGLRFVISGTVEQRKKMETFLADSHKKEILNYGIHSSRGLIVTCYITDYHRQHVHFVDGMDGGYAMAAKMMKNQKKIV